MTMIVGYFSPGIGGTLLRAASQIDLCTYVPMEEADIKVLVWRSMSFLARDHLQQHIFLFLLHFHWV